MRYGEKGRKELLWVRWTGGCVGNCMRSIDAITLLTVNSLRCSSVALLNLQEVSCTIHTSS